MLALLTTKMITTVAIPWARTAFLAMFFCRARAKTAVNIIKMKVNIIKMKHYASEAGHST